LMKFILSSFGIPHARHFALRGMFFQFSIFVA
jgi:hypothetical protein